MELQNGGSRKQVVVISEVVVNSGLSVGLTCQVHGTIKTGGVNMKVEISVCESCGLVGSEDGLRVRTPSKPVY